jgi:hypothetical protein
VPLTLSLSQASKDRRYPEPFGLGICGGGLLQVWAGRVSN